MRDISTYEHPAAALVLPFEVVVPEGFDADGRIDDLLQGGGLYEYFKDGDVWDWSNVRRNIAAIFAIVAFETRSLPLAFAIAATVYIILWDTLQESDEGRAFCDEMALAYDWLLGARAVVLNSLS
jgi:hypothetical protein